MNGSRVASRTPSPATTAWQRMGAFIPSNQTSTGWRSSSPGSTSLCSRSASFWPSSRNSMPAPGHLQRRRGRSRTHPGHPPAQRAAFTGEHQPALHFGPGCGQLGPGDVDPSRAQVLDAGDDALVSSRRAQANLRLEDDATLAPKLHRLCWTPENTASLRHPYRSDKAQSARRPRVLQGRYQIDRIDCDRSDRAGLPTSCSASCCWDTSEVPRVGGRGGGGAGAVVAAADVSCRPAPGRGIPPLAGCSTGGTAGRSGPSKQPVPRWQSVCTLHGENTDRGPGSRQARSLVPLKRVAGVLAAGATGLVHRIAADRRRRPGVHRPGAVQMPQREPGTTWQIGYLLVHDGAPGSQYGRHAWPSGPAKQPIPSLQSDGLRQDAPSAPGPGSRHCQPPCG